MIKNFFKKNNVVGDHDKNIDMLVKLILSNNDIKYLRLVSNKVKIKIIRDYLKGQKTITLNHLIENKFKSYGTFGFNEFLKSI